MMRDNEKEGELTGATWVFVGALFTILLVPYPYSILALLFLSVGDTFAAIIGIKFPLIKVGEKTLSGSAAGFLACIIIGFIVDLSIRYEIVFFGAIMAMVIELIPLPINDNLSIPLFSGSAMYFFSLVL
jgi:glycerol-3-phosphate acyltransferase PlsY